MERRDWGNQGSDFQTGIAGLSYLAILKSRINENTRALLCPRWTTCSMHILLFNLYCFFFNDKGNSEHTRKCILHMAVILTLKLNTKQDLAIGKRTCDRSTAHTIALVSGCNKVHPERRLFTNSKLILFYCVHF